MKSSEINQGELNLIQHKLFIIYAIFVNFMRPKVHHQIVSKENTKNVGFFGFCWKELSVQDYFTIPGKKDDFTIIQLLWKRVVF